MSDTAYTTRSDPEDAFAQFRDETATLVADVVTDHLREFRGGNGLPPAPHSDSARIKTSESDAALILQGIAALSEAAALTRSEVGELKADVAAVKAEVSEIKAELKADVAELRLEMADVKTENRSTRQALEATAQLIRNEIATEHAELRTDMAGEVSKARENVRELRGETRPRSGYSVSLLRRRLAF